MDRPKFFKTVDGKKLPLPIFFPDATRGVVKTLDSIDIKNTKTPGVLVNIYHLYKELGGSVIKEHGGIRKFMNWEGAVISDSGGFQVMTLAKAASPKGKVTDAGVTFYTEEHKKIFFTPEISIDFQMLNKTDLMVVLDDFTDPKASYEEAKESVRRTVEWAKRSKDEFEKKCQEKKLIKKNRPYLIGVVQGGDFLDLREYCTKELVKIGFDGLGYGGWPINAEGKFNYDVAKVIAENSPHNYLLYGLGIGKPQEIVGCYKLGFSIFDCVLPTRDARHKRLYIYNADSIENININEDNFYSYYTPDKEKYYRDKKPVSAACDCHLCHNYSRAYLAHLFRIKELNAMRLASIHNLRFFSLLLAELSRLDGY